MQNNPIFVAMDTADLAQAEALAARLAPHLGGVKLGLEFFLAHGREGVSRIAAQGLPIFLDLKLHDIPNTVEKAVRSLAGLPIHMLTVHASGGEAMLTRARAASETLVTGGKRPLVIAVTVLTSLDASDLTAIGYDRAPEAQAVHLAKLAHRAGVDGIVCSPHEIRAIRAATAPEFVTVVPGIRPAGAELGDQKRTLTPKEAVEAGASYLVIGRPITEAPDPASAAAKIVASLA